MRRYLVACAIAGFLFAWIGELHAAVGRTETAFAVSPTGEAVYSIPIFTPPGTNGMTPEVSLVYGHRNPSTLVGAGWSISGISVISRCPRTWTQDGSPRDVRNDYDDKFCLDGNRLRRVSETAYGHDGAEYRTEIETFARIRSYGIAGNGPTHFIVEMKNGLRYEYGNTPDSRIESVWPDLSSSDATYTDLDRSNSIGLT